ncbi:hypothetical protein CDCA_CDCA08G2487 [Cyanidium caldarium]|uniref:Cryptochrome DASH n=1 Tax=Cyanidium caldarium TaxID=2771 RepID=A0AAV9IVU9_CYACA|nr:hypothetical protein CDCA_CDCA08G2487 [Cyanidium caldarium]
MFLRAWPVQTRLGGRVLSRSWCSFTSPTVGDRSQRRRWWGWRRPVALAARRLSVRMEFDGLQLEAGFPRNEPEPEFRHEGEFVSTTYADSLVKPVPRAQMPAQLDGTALMWFRNDLRVHDNEALLLGNRGTALLCVYVFDERQFYAKSRLGGYPRIGPHRAYYIRECVEALRDSLRAHNNELYIEVGLPEEVIPRLATRYGVRHLVFSKEVTCEEVATENAVVRAVQQATAAANAPPVQFHAVWTSTLVHWEDLPFHVPNLHGGQAPSHGDEAQRPARRPLPSVFTGFRKGVEAAADWHVRPPLKCPERLTLFPLEAIEGGVMDWAGQLPPEYPNEAVREWGDTQRKLLIERPYPDPRSCFDFHGGEEQALKRVEQWIWVKDMLPMYKQVRDDLDGGDSSSKFATFLAHGCLSPRYAYAEVRRYEQQNGASQSSYWLLFELLWRDFFRYTALVQGNRLFQKRGMQFADPPTSSAASSSSAVIERQPDLTPAAALKAWCDGSTGIPLIDAAMRELRLTGYTSNRSRQIVASFLVKDLGVDWRLGAEWFEAQLIDYDPCSNWGNWSYVAGVGNDPRGAYRYFHPLKQAYEHDNEGLFVKGWLPQLLWIYPQYLHTPWNWDEAMQKRVGVTLGKDYPHPIVRLREPAHRPKPPDTPYLEQIDADIGEQPPIDLEVPAHWVTPMNEHLRKWDFKPSEPE